MTRPAAGVPTRLAQPSFRRPSRSAAAAAAEKTESAVPADSLALPIAGDDPFFGFEYDTAAQPGRALTAPDGSAFVAAVESEDNKKIETTFGRLRAQLVAECEEPGERANLAVLKALQEMCLDLIPIAEEKYRQGGAERAAYALNVYVNQVREIQNDMRGVHDFSQVGFKIMEIVAHHFTLIAQNLMTEYSRLQQVVNTTADPAAREAILTAANNMIQVQGLFLNESMKGMRDLVMAQFVTPSLPKYPGKKLAAAGPKR